MNSPGRKAHSVNGERDTILIREEKAKGYYILGGIEVPAKTIETTIRRNFIAVWKVTTSHPEGGVAIPDKQPVKESED